MQIPVTNAEIARFLGVSEGQVAYQISLGSIQSSVTCPYRMVESLSWPSIYDVVEFALSSGYLSVTVSNAEAVVWLDSLASADQDEGFFHQGIEGQLRQLLDFAPCDRLNDQDFGNTIQIALAVLKARSNLLDICIEAEAAVA